MIILAEKLVIACQLGGKIRGEEAVLQDRDRGSSRHDDQLTSPVEPVEHGFLLERIQVVWRHAVPDDVADRRPGQRMRRDERLVGLERQDQPIVTGLVESRRVFPIDRVGKERLIPVPGVVGVVGFLGEDQDEHLMRKERANDHWRRFVGPDRVGSGELEEQLLGDHGKQHLHADPSLLGLEEPRVPTEDDLLRHPLESDRGGLPPAVVVAKIGADFQAQRAPVVGLHERQDVERGDLGPEELDRGAVLVLVELLLDALRVGQDLELLHRRRDLREGPRPCHQGR